MHTAIRSWSLLAGIALAVLLAACSGSKVCETNATQACGNCGTQTCTIDGAWGSCTGEGVCKAGASQACTGGGTQSCGVTCEWGACLGGTCTGSATQACGKCGTQTCGADGKWGACSGEGVCQPGASQPCASGGVQSCGTTCSWGACLGGTCTPSATQACGNCGTQTCGADGKWGSCASEGVCKPGATQSCTGGTQTCAATCTWNSCPTAADYEILQLGSATITVDGRCDEGAWSKANAVAFSGAKDSTFNNDQTLRLLWKAGSPARLCFCLAAKDKDLEAAVSGKDVDNLWNDDAIEMFWSTDSSRTWSSKVIKVIANLRGAIWDANMKADGSFELSYDDHVTVAVTNYGTLNAATDTDTGYVVEGCMDIGSTVAADTTGLCNFLVDDADGSTVSHFRFKGPTGNFNDISNFGMCKYSSTVIASCTANCSGKTCGQDDGCGGKCSACTGSQVCDELSGKCEQGCVPDCSGKQCGSDKCGGSCAPGCSGSQTCDSNGQCQTGSVHYPISGWPQWPNGVEFTQLIGDAKAAVAKAHIMPYDGAAHTTYYDYNGSGDLYFDPSNTTILAPWANNPGQAIYLASSSDPTYTLKCVGDAYCGATSGYLTDGTTNIHIPKGAIAQGYPKGTCDCHLHAIQPVGWHPANLPQLPSPFAYEIDMWNVSTVAGSAGYSGDGLFDNGGTIYAVGAALFSTQGPGWYGGTQPWNDGPPAGYIGSANFSDSAYTASHITPDDLIQGSINHLLFWASVCSAPATSAYPSASKGTDSVCPKDAQGNVKQGFVYGDRLWLDVPPSQLDSVAPGLTPIQKIFAATMYNYGAFVGDNIGYWGPTFYVGRVSDTFTAGSSWQDVVTKYNLKGDSANGYSLGMTLPKVLMDHVHAIDRCVSDGSC